jgi:hypothetical protein
LNCPVCSEDAEQIPITSGGIRIVCAICGEYDISSSVIATGQWQRLEQEERGDALSRAKRSAQPGARPVITPYLLA